MSKRLLTCICENKFEVDVPDTIDLSEKPDIAVDIRTGHFLEYRCPLCGKLLKPEFPLHIVDKKHGIDVFFIPELDRGKYFRKKLEYEVGKPDRVVIGYPELIEKLLLQSEGIDDRAVELIKYYMVRKALSENAKAIPKITVTVVERGKMKFQLEGLRDDSVGITWIEHGTYKKALKDIKRRLDSTLKRILEPPYVSVRKLEWE